MELGTSLQEVIDTPAMSHALSWGREKLTLALSIVKGVEHLHGLGLQHANLKPTNVILLAMGSNAKLADPSASDDAVARTLERAESAQYMAPAMLRRDELGPKGDIWAVGCLLEVLVRAAPHTP